MDNFARPERAASTARSIDRRTLLRAGAWAAPVVAVAVASPAASASDTPVQAAAGVAVAPQVRLYGDHGIAVDSARFQYDYAAWNLQDEASGPTAVMMTFRVVVKNAAGVIVATLVPQETASIAKYQDVERKGQVAGLPAGTYTVVSEIISNVFSPNPTGGRFFSSPATSTSVEVTIAATPPAKPVLSNNNWDNNGTFTVTANLWSGVNASGWELTENGITVGSGALTPNTPQAQAVAVNITGRPLGSYTYVMKFTNLDGTTSSDPMVVNVTV
ncbi:hypothetical protein LG299_14115 [Microbacterium lacus]|uniref:hypothetical protein n=1 Tax=Microbacterium lacus TaxID=415217 RepID=UPI0038513AE6